MKPALFFAHGNGFPALCYRQMLSQLEERYDCYYIDQVGHNPRFPISENWNNLVLETLDSIKSQVDRPVIAVGHSLGGVLHLLAAIKEPELFKAVILLDSPLLGRFKSGVVRLAKALGIIDRITPAYRTSGRRVFWKDKTQLIRYLREKTLFQTFSPECLEDYINYGLSHEEGGYYLKFERHIEYQIYRTIPHHLPGLEGKFIVPGVLLYGDKSTVVDRMDRRYMRRKFHITSIKVHGTHMFPMEHPVDAAHKIFEAIDLILTEKGRNAC